MTVLIVVEAQVFHDLKQFLHDYGALELWLGQHAQQILHLLVAQVVDAKPLDAINEALRREKLQDLPRNFRFKDLVIEQLADRAHILFDDLFSYLNEDALGHINYLILINILFIFIFFVLVLVLLILLGFFDRRLEALFGDVLRLQLDLIIILLLFIFLVLDRG